MSRYLKKIKKTRNILIGVVIVFAVFSVLTFDSWDDWLAGSGLVDTEPTVKTTSTFSFYDAASGEIVTAHLHISVWKNDPDEGTLTGDDIYKLSMYEEDIKTKDAADATGD